MDELSKRNFGALSEGLKQLRSDMSQLKIEVKQKDEHIAQLQQDLNAMQVQIGQMTARFTGTGPTGA